MHRDLIELPTTLLPLSCWNYSACPPSWHTTSLTMPVNEIQQNANEKFSQRQRSYLLNQVNDQKRARIGCNRAVLQATDREGGGKGKKKDSSKCHLLHGHKMMALIISQQYVAGASVYNEVSPCDRIKMNPTRSIDNSL